MPNVGNNLLEDRALSENLLACRAQRCNNLGECVIQNGLQVCKCMLGYRGSECQETVNDGLAVPLTLGVLGFVIGFIILAFALAFVQQRRRERLWYDISFGFVDHRSQMYRSEQFLFCLFKAWDFLVC